jgi:hypothetical protein
VTGAALSHKGHGTVGIRTVEPHHPSQSHQRDYIPLITKRECRGATTPDISEPTGKKSQSSIAGEADMSEVDSREDKRRRVKKWVMTALKLVAAAALILIMVMAYMRKHG